MVDKGFAKCYYKRNKLRRIAYEAEKFRCSYSYVFCDDDVGAYCICGRCVKCRDWVGVLKSGVYTGVQAAEGFILSKEFMNKDMTNEVYVRIMYRAFFSKDAGSAGFETWFNALVNGWTKEAVFVGFANSVEFGGFVNLMVLLVER